MRDAAGGTGLDPAAVPDLWPRLLLSPLLGAVVVNLAGFIDHARHSPPALAAAYVWFTAVALVVWEGNRRLYFRLPRREDWLLRPWRRLGVLLAVICLYTVPATALMLWIWRHATGDPGTRPYALAMALFVVVALVIAITHVYETAFLLRDWESARLRSARTEQARLQTELESLGREVDPHLLFNSLNALSHLVEQGSDRAVPFISALSATYQYVVVCRGKTLVPLAWELEALERHRLLADIRYAGQVRLDVRIDPADAAACSLPPITLTELFQNALKHNTVARDRPLHIRVRIDADTLVFENDLRQAVVAPHSTGVGLANMAQRFRIATGRAIVWRADAGVFAVTLPLVRRGGDPGGA